MASKQTRRSVSVKGLTYQRVKKHCDASGKTISGFVEELIAAKLGQPDDEDRRKFGEAMKMREEEAKAKEAKADDFDQSYIPPIQSF